MYFESPSKIYVHIFSFISKTGKKYFYISILTSDITWNSKELNYD